MSKNLRKMVAASCGTLLLSVGIAITASIAIFQRVALDPVTKKTSPEKATESTASTLTLGELIEIFSPHTTKDVFLDHIDNTVGNATKAILETNNIVQIFHYVDLKHYKLDGEEYWLIVDDRDEANILLDISDSILEARMHLASLPPEQWPTGQELEARIHATLAEIVETQAPALLTTIPKNARHLIPGYDKLQSAMESDIANFAHRITCFMFGNRLHGVANTPAELERLTRINTELTNDIPIILSSLFNGNEYVAEDNSSPLDINLLVTNLETIMLEALNEPYGGIDVSGHHGLTFLEVFRFSQLAKAYATLHHDVIAPNNKPTLHDFHHFLDQNPLLTMWVTTGGPLPNAYNLSNIPLDTSIPVFVSPQPHIDIEETVLWTERLVPEPTIRSR